MTDTQASNLEGDKELPAPAPEFLRGGPLTEDSSEQKMAKPASVKSPDKSQKTKASKPKGFRPSRGPNPWVYGVIAAMFGVLGGAILAGVVPPLPAEFMTAFTAVFTTVFPVALDASSVAYGLWAGAGGLLLGMAWAFGRRSNQDIDALMVHLAAGKTGAPLMITDQDGNILYANPGFEKLLNPTNSGEIPSALAINPKDEDTLSIVRRLQDGALNGALMEEEIQLTKARLGGQWWALSARPLHRAKRGKGVISWSARDVTSRRELDTVRRSEEGLLADLLDNLPVGFFSVDGAGRIVYANETLCGWLGLTLGEIREQHLGFSDFVTASGEYVEDGDGLNGQVTLMSKSGKPFRGMLIQSGRMDDEGELIYTRSIIVRDLVRKTSPLETMAVEAQSAEDNNDAVEIARRLYWLFDEAPVAIALLDMKANITDCNGAFLKMLGLHKDDVLANPFSERLAAEDQSDVNAQLSKVVMGIMRAAHVEVRLLAVGGREVSASLYASRMEDAFGEVTGLVVHFIDTTDHRQLEVQFAQSQKMQSIGQLAGGIAHDFNNLLTVMIGFSDLLLTRHGPGDPSFSDIEQIRQNAMRATALVRQLLAFSRKQTLAPQAVGVKEKLSDLSEVLNRLLGVTIDMNIENDRDLWLVHVDPVQLDQVIMNLVVNARDAMPGGGTLTIRTANLTLTEPTQRGLELVAAGEYVTISVIDTGEGIRKEDIARIFEPFFSTKDVGEGTGLGLSTVYGIVHQTGGHVWVDSAPGEGAAFSVNLPRFRVETNEDAGLQAISEVKKAEESNPVSQVNRPGAMQKEDADLTGVGTILLVEDEDAVRMFGSRALRNKGYKVLEADNGEAALDVINSTDAKIDLIVTDVMMPGMDGHTLVQFVRQEMPTVKVIFISGYAENVIPGGITPESGFEFLPKPFSLKDLASKVKEVMERP